MLVKRIRLRTPRHRASLTNAIVPIIRPIILFSTHIHRHMATTVSISPMRSMINHDYNHSKSIRIIHINYITFNIPFKLYRHRRARPTVDRCHVRTSPCPFGRSIEFSIGNSTKIFSNGEFISFFFFSFYLPGIQKLLFCLQAPGELSLSGRHLPATLYIIFTL